MKKRHLLYLVALASIALVAAIYPRAADAGSVVYVAGSGNEFGTLDLTTGNFTQIGTLNLPSGVHIFGMGFGSDGHLYGLDSSVPNANLVQINVSDASVTTVGAINQSVLDATTDASGTIYALSQDSNATFYTLDPPSTATSVVGPTGIASTGLMAVNASGTQIFTTAFNPSTGTADLYRIDPTTGAASLIGDTGFGITNGLFVNGTLYGFDPFGAIVTIDTSTGAGTRVATYNLPNADSIFAAASAIPEPSSVVLGLIAVALGGSLGLLHRWPSTPGAE